jgi:hypothetical protein
MPASRCGCGSIPSGPPQHRRCAAQDGGIPVHRRRPARLTQLGARPAGPAPASPAAGQLGIPNAVEVDRVVSAAGLVGLAGRRVSVGQQYAGQRVTIRVDADLLQAGLDGVLVKAMPSPIPAAVRAHLQGARAATTAFQPPRGPVVVQRRVSCRGGIQVANQRVQVGLPHAGKVVAVRVHDARLGVVDDQVLLTTVPRTTHKQVTRYQAAEHQLQAQQVKRCQASTETQPSNINQDWTHCRNTRNPREPSLRVQAGSCSPARKPACPG